MREKGNIHCPWFLMGVTAFFRRQSTEVGADTGASSKSVITAGVLVMRVPR